MGDRFFDPIYANGTRTLLGVGAAWHVPQVTLAGELIRAADTRLGQGIDGGDLSDLVSRGGYASAVWHVIHGKGRRRGSAPFRELDVTGRVDWLHFGSANTADQPFRNPRADARGADRQARGDHGRELAPEPVDEGADQRRARAAAWTRWRVLPGRRQRRSGAPSSVRRW